MAQWDDTYRKGWRAGYVKAAKLTAPQARKLAATMAGSRSERKKGYRAALLFAAMQRCPKKRKKASNPSRRRNSHGGGSVRSNPPLGLSGTNWLLIGGLVILVLFLIQQRAKAEAAAIPPPPTGPPQLGPGGYVDIHGGTVVNLPGGETIIAQDLDGYGLGTYFRV